MAILPPKMDIVLEFEPIVKLVCYALDCANNLTNASNDSNEQMTCCNLKQITVGDKGQCLNYRKKQ